MSKKDTGSKYLDLLVNSANRIQAWRIISFCLMGVVVLLSFALIKAVNMAPTRLVPYEYATNNGYVTVKPGGDNSEHYLSFIADADIKLYTDWTSDTIGNQYARLQNRMTPELYAQKNVKLTAEARDIDKTSYSQAFFPSRRIATGKNKIQIEGILSRWAGERLVLTQKVRYQLVYRYYNDIPSLLDFELIESRKQ